MSDPYDSADRKKSSVLGPTLKFKGELSADEDLLIQGQVEGSIKHTSNLTIGKEGKVKANVSAAYIAVEGTVKGDLTGSQSVTVHETANIAGNIYSPTVSLLEGATFNGKIDMTGKAQPQAKPREEQPVQAGSAVDSGKEKAESTEQKKSSKQQKSAASAA